MVKKIFPEQFNNIWGENMLPKLNISAHFFFPSHFFQGILSLQKGSSLDLFLIEKSSLVGIYIEGFSQRDNWRPLLRVLDFIFYVGFI